MRISIFLFLLGTCSAFVFGCSNPQKKQAATPPPAASAPVPAPSQPAASAVTSSATLSAAAASSATTPAAAASARQVPTSAQIALPVAPAKVEAPKGELACQREQEIRTLQVADSQPKGCKLFYSSHSSKDAVAWSHMGNTHCEQVRDRIRGRLEEAGFKCSAEQAQSPASSVQTAAQPAKVPATEAKAEAPKAKN